MASFVRLQKAMAIAPVTANGRILALQKLSGGQYRTFTHHRSHAAGFGHARSISYKSVMPASSSRLRFLATVAEKGHDFGPYRDKEPLPHASLRQYLVAISGKHATRR